MCRRGSRDVPGQLRSDATCPVCGDPLDAIVDTTNFAGVVRQYYHDKRGPKLRRRLPCKMGFSDYEEAKRQRDGLEVASMPRYRIFTNDRSRCNDIPMYSALMDVSASSPEEARKLCPRKLGLYPCAPVVAIRWPVSEQSDDEKKWLLKHVG